MIWPKQFTAIALTFIFVLLFVHIAFFPQFIIPFEILFFGIMVMVLFFTSLNYYSRKWSRISEKSFVTNLFLTSFGIKLLFFAATLLLIFIVDPESYPFEIGGGMDSRYYHFVGAKIAHKIFSGGLSEILHKYYEQTGDFGYPTYLGFFYHFFGNDSILIRILTFLFSSLTPVLVFKLAKNIYNENVARFSAILTMLMPAMLWFDTVLLKENLMIFLIILCLYEVSEIVLTRRFRLLNIVLAVTSMVLLFFFRAVIAWLIVFVVMFYLLLNLGNRRVSRPLVFISFLVIAIIMSVWVINTGSLSELKLMVDQSDTLMEDEIAGAMMSRGLSFNLIAIAPLMYASAFLTPFPSLLYFNPGQIVMVSHFFNELVRNCIYFFAFLGILVSYKKRFKESSLILLFTLGYIFILAVSGKSFQDRFQLPSMPGILIFISVGLAGGGKHIKKWGVYLIAVGIGIILWNLFKLRIRGLI